MIHFLDGISGGVKLKEEHLLCTIFSLFWAKEILIGKSQRHNADDPCFSIFFIKNSQPLGKLPSEIVTTICTL